MVDFADTFVPTVSRFLRPLSATITRELGLDVWRHFNVDQAFVQSKPDKDVFLRVCRRDVVVFPVKLCV